MDPVTLTLIITGITEAISAVRKLMDSQNQPPTQAMLDAEDALRAKLVELADQLDKPTDPKP